MEPMTHRRLRVLFALFAVATVVLSLRTAYWQTLGRDRLLSQATGQIRSDLVLAAARGVIRDRTGAILATTVPLRSLYAIPARMPDHAAAATALAPLLGMTVADIRERLDSGAEWLYLRRRLPEPAADAVAALALPGLGF